MQKEVEVVQFCYCNRYLTIWSVSHGSRSVELLGSNLDPDASKSQWFRRKSVTDVTVANFPGAHALPNKALAMCYASNNKKDFGGGLCYGGGTYRGLHTRPLLLQVTKLLGLVCHTNAFYTSGQCAIIGQCNEYLPVTVEYRNSNTPSGQKKSTIQQSCCWIIAKFH